MIKYIYNLIHNLQHKLWIIFYSLKICIKILKRAILHDLSKFRWDEFSIFSRYILELKNAEYGQESYNKLLELSKPARELHYSRNRHHPQYHTNGFIDMTFLDRLEMAIDWKAAQKKSKSCKTCNPVQYNKDRFNYNNTDSHWLSLIEKEL